jgi:hypothetical protein
VSVSLGDKTKQEQMSAHTQSVVLSKLDPPDDFIGPWNPHFGLTFGEKVVDFVEVQDLSTKKIRKALILHLDIFIAKARRLP